MEGEGVCVSMRVGTPDPLALPSNSRSQGWQEWNLGIV